MPELPEVEIMTRNVRQWCAGRQLVRAEVLDPRLGIALSDVEGQPIGPAWRRGKYLCLPIGEDVLVLHFRMTGKAVIEAEGPRKYARLRLHLDAGPPLVMVDTRRLGRVWRMPAEAVERFFEAVPLGPEPWPEVRSGVWWQARLAGLRGALKGSLMRQDRVAGLGNIAASEICFRAGIDPRTPTPALSEGDWAAVAEAVPAFVEHVLAEESGPEIAYINEGRNAPNPFLVYARAGEPCRRCAGGRVQRLVQAGRSTFWCARCQLPRKTF